MNSLDAARPVSIDTGLLTVVAPRRQADLRVPLDVEVAALLPELCDLLCTEDERDGAQLWMLAPTLGAAIEVSLSLAEAGVRDGDTLRLLSVDALGPPPRVVDIVEEASGSGGWLWTRLLRRTVLLGAIVLVLVAGAVLAELLAPPSSPRLVLTGLAAGVLAIAAAMRLVRSANALTAHVLVLASLPLWMLCGAHLPVTPPGDRLARLLLAGAVLLGALLAQHALLPSLRAVTAALLITVIPGEAVLAVVRLTHGSGRILAAVLILAWISLLPYAPRLAAMTSGLSALARPQSTAEELDQSGGPAPRAPVLNHEEISRRLAAARACLVTLLGSAIVGLAACWAGLIVVGPTGWSLGLLALCPMIIALRASHHRQAGEVLVLVVAALLSCAALVAAGLVAWDRPRADLGPMIALIAVLLAALLLLVVVLDRTPGNVVALQLFAKRLEIGLRVAVIVVAVGATGAYGDVLGLADTLGRNMHL